MWLQALITTVICRFITSVITKWIDLGKSHTSCKHKLEMENISFIALIDRIYMANASSIFN
jgi:hypothetical protein